MTNLDSVLGLALGAGTCEMNTGIQNRERTHVQTTALRGSPSGVVLVALATGF